VNENFSINDHTQAQSIEGTATIYHSFITLNNFNNNNINE